MRTCFDLSKETIERGSRISAASKLEGMRLLNELADKVLTLRQKIARRKARETR